MAVIGIHAEEFVPNTYKSVYVFLNDGHQEIFETGDPIQDFINGLEYGHQRDGRVIYSSSVDNFVCDDPSYDYEYDPNLYCNVIKKV